MLAYIDDFLNGITMYRLALYTLTAFALEAFFLSFLKLLPFQSLLLLFSILIMIVFCWIVNTIFAQILKVPTNVESVYITAFILFLIIPPEASFIDKDFLVFAVLACLIGVGSKYVLAIRRKHVFNPAAIGVVLTSLVISASPSWWIGNIWTLPMVIIGGLLIVRKLQRGDLVISFLVVSILSLEITSLLNHANPLQDLGRLIAHTPLLFFAFIMLTEPLTTPPTRNMQIIYGGLVGLLFAPAFHFGPFYSSPEIALVIGNIFSYIVSPKEKLILKLKEMKEIARDTYSFAFAPNRKLFFEAGQYLEWTLPAGKSDARGNRRYFTIASSPTESDIQIGVKFYPEPSTFKQHLRSLGTGDMMVASQKAGDFTLPEDKNEKLIFIAGGIGITPFRSMIKYLIDKKERRDIILFYSNKIMEDIAYADILEEGHRELGIKTIYALTEIESIPSGWPSEKGFVNEEMIKKKAPDFKERTFYMSGPPSMVNAFDVTLKKMGVPDDRIKKDFFPGYA